MTLHCGIMRCVALLSIALMACGPEPERPEVELTPTASATWRRDNVIEVTGSLFLNVHTSTPTSLATESLRLHARDASGLQVELVVQPDAISETIVGDASRKFELDFVGSGIPFDVPFKGDAFCPGSIDLELELRLITDAGAIELATTTVTPVVCDQCPENTPDTSVLDELSLAHAWDTQLFGSNLLHVDRTQIGPDGALWMSGTTIGGSTLIRVFEDGADAFPKHGEVSNFVVDAERVYVGTSAGVDDLTIVASSYDGDVLWSHALPTQYGPPQLALSNGRLLVSYDAIEDAELGEQTLPANSTYLLVFDAATGAVEDVQPWDPIRTIASDGADRIYVATAQAVQSLKSDLSVRWSVQPGFDTNGALALSFARDELYLVAREPLSVVAFSGAGEQRWQRVLEGYAYSLAPLPNGELLVAAGDGLYQLDADGEVLDRVGRHYANELPFCPLDETVTFGADGQGVVFVSAKLGPTEGLVAAGHPNGIERLRAGRFALP